MEGLMNAHYLLERAPIPAERWEKVYGWDHDKSISMGGTGSEVRLYHVDAGGERRDLAPGRDGGFEFGYGGGGPHESAGAIVVDLCSIIVDKTWREQMTAANLQDWVPEVFDVAESGGANVIVYPTDVRMRMGLNPE
jgi:hypothetical protein